MDKKFYICAAIVLLIALLALLAIKNLEIYPKKARVLPSREALSNNFYALERWLDASGRPVRVETRYDPVKIAAAPEKVIVALSSACLWENADEHIRPWMEKGGCLVISVDYSEGEIDAELLNFLSGFGIGIMEIDDYENFTSESISDFYNDIYFTVEGDSNIITVNDSRGNARLAELSLGEGALVVTGKLRFMQNYSLSRDINARQSWALTGARAGEDGGGVLFIRDKILPKSLFGKLIERGNLVPIAVSSLLLLFLIFWKVIPVFGLVFEEKRISSRPIKERFTAEIRFLKKYGALGHYLETYKRELKLLFLEHETDKTLPYRELINQLQKYETIQEGKRWNRQI